MHATQSGQALPLGLALLLIGALGALVLFNTGQVATEKSRLANAADAAAYSGLVWQARALNFQAYTNRAMVANQVTMAQAVSLNSWTAYGAMTSEGLAAATAAIPGANVLTRGLAVGLQGVSRVMEPLSSVVVTIVDTVNRVLSGSQQAMFASSFVATPEIVRKVALASDPDFTSDTRYGIAGLARNINDWQSFTEKVEDDELDRLRERGDVMMRSRDAFTDDRSWEFFENFWMYITPFTRHKIFREGDTRLVALEVDGELRWEWRAVDTIAVQTRVFRFLRSERKSESPIGWASAYANDDRRSASILESHCDRGSNRSSADCRYWTNKNHRTERNARRAAAVVSGYSGVQAYRTLSEGALQQEGHDPVIRLRTEIAVDLPNVRSSDDLTSGEVFDTNISAPGNQLSSISVAEVHYRRPESANHSDSAGRSAALRLEAANGYNPYWTVRLVPVELEERLLAVGLRLASNDGASAPTESGSATLPGFDESSSGARPGRNGRPETADSPGALPTYATEDVAPAAGNGVSQVAGAASGAASVAGAANGIADGFATSVANGDFTQIAAAYGVDGSSLRDEIGARTGLQLPPIEDLEIFENPVGFVTDELESVLEDAARDIISGLGESVTGTVQGVQDQISDEIPGAGELAAGVAQAAAFAEDMRLLRDEVADDFEPVLTARLATYAADLQGMNGQLVVLRGELAVASGDLDIAVQNSIEALEGRLHGARSVLLDDLTDSLMGIIRSRATGDLGELFTRASTRSMVDALLQALDDDSDIDIGDVFPWAP